MIGALMLRGDLLRLACGSRTWWLRGLFVAVLVIAAAIVWPWDGLRANPEAGDNLLLAFLCCEILAAGLAVPAIIAPAIAGEREKGTLDILAACPHTEADMVAGRLGASATWVTSLLFAGVPFAVMAVVIGGASVQRVAIACADIALTGIFATELAIFASITTKNSMSATTSALTAQVGAAVGGFLLACIVLALSILDTDLTWWVGGFLVAGGVLFWIGIRAHARPAMSVGALLFIIAGLISMGALTVGHFGGYRTHLPPMYVFAMLCPWSTYAGDFMESGPYPVGVLGVAWTAHVALCLGVLALIRRAVARGDLVAGPVSVSVGLPVLMRLRRRKPATPVMLPAAKPSPLAVRSGAEEAPGKPKLAAAQYIMVPPEEVAKVQEGWLRRRSRRAVLPVRGNPVFWKDTLLKSQVSGCVLALAIAGAGIALIASLFPDDQGPGRWNGSHGGLHFELFMAGILLVPICAGSITPEHASGTLPILIATGYSPAQILVGKLLACLWHLRALVVIIWLHLALAVLDVGAGGALAAWVFAVSLVGPAAVAIAASAITGNARFASSTALVALFILWLAGTFVSMSPRFRELGELNPFRLLDATLNLRVDDSYSGYYTYGYARRPGVLPCVVLWSAFQGLVATAALAVASRVVAKAARS